MRIGILSSSRGSHLTPIFEAIQQKKLNASIEIIVSNKPDAPILKRANSHGIIHQYINPMGLTREVFDEKISTEFEKYNVDLIILIGYMRILSNEFVSKWKNKIINVHPSLLPAFAGKMDLAVHEAVLKSGATETGCTVHYVTEMVDAGPIILQKKCAVYPLDTPDSLKPRVQEIEAQALIEVLSLLSKIN